MIHTILFFGRSGSGKGTQAQMLCDAIREEGYMPVYVQTGDLVRAYLQHIKVHPRAYEAALIQEVESGGLLPSFVAIKLWADILLREVEEESILVLDGLCRRAEEAHILHGALTFLGRNDASIIHLGITPEESTVRLLGRGRKDDTPEGISRRLAWYTKNVVPAENFFRTHTIYANHDIDGMQSKEIIHAHIKKTLFI